jgi:hypothetical protein
VPLGGAVVAAEGIMCVLVELAALGKMGEKGPEIFPVNNGFFL